MPTFGGIIRRIRQRLFLVGAATLTVLTLSVGTAAAVEMPRAASTADHTISSAVTVHKVVDDANERATLARYWTPQRMKAAIPLDTPASGKPSAGSTGHPAGPASRLASPQGPTGDTVRPDNLTAPATQGKVFFYDPADGNDYVCSAGTVNSPAKDMVFTAGHCINDCNGTWMEDWAYAPAYYDGDAPYGLWYANYQTSFNGWLDYCDLNYDVGVVNVLTNNSTELVDETGANGLVDNQGVPVVTIWGYPAAPPYTGEIPYYCEDVQTSVVSILDPRLAAGCAMTQGASGGPWLMNYDANSGLGDEDGVTSTNIPGSPGYIASPFFDSNIATIYADTENK